MFQQNMIDEDGDRTPLWQRRAFEMNPLLREFPAKTNILIVDTHFVSLLNMKEMMKQYNYQVTIYTDAEEALAFLKNRKHEINLVLWNFHMPIINGIQALKIIATEMDLPVVIISDDDETESVMQATLHGASDYVLKPIRQEVIATIWKHIIKKIVRSKSGLIQSVQSNSVQIGGLQANDNPNITKKQEKRPQIPAQTSGLDRDNEASKTMDAYYINKKKEKRPQIPVQTFGPDRDNEGSKTVDQDQMDKREDQKKPRLMWTTDLQKKFLKSVDLCGGAEKANPKILLKCMQDMNVEGLTRHNVSSHLQKHRQYLEETRIAQGKREISRSTANIAHPNNVQTTIPSYLIKDGDNMNNMFQHNQFIPFPYFDHHQHHYLHQHQQSPTVTSSQPHLPYLLDHHHHHHHLHQQHQQSQSHLPYFDHHHHHCQQQAPSPLASATSQPRLHQEQEQSNFQISDNVMIKNEPENDFGIEAMNTELIYPALPFDPKEFLVVDGFNFKK